MMHLSSAAFGLATYDAAIYDATSGGVTAAVSAARNGLKTVLLCASWPACYPEGGQRIGGMSSGGLGQTDVGITGPYVGGIAREFYERNRARYTVAQPGLEATSEPCRLPAAGCNHTFNLEPHVARDIFTDLLREAGVEVLYSAQLASVRVAGGAAPTVQGITTADGREVQARVWVDASYEGDLLAAANVSYAVGREARAVHNESLAGMSPGAVGNQFSVAVDPFDASGAPLPFTSLPPQGRAIGSGDAYVQSYNFRLCVTQNQSNRAPFPKPDSYDAADWELLRRYVLACDGKASADGCQLGFPSCNTAPVPSGKYDMNNCGGIASDLIGGSWARRATRPMLCYAMRCYAMLCDAMLCYAMLCYAIPIGIPGRAARKAARHLARTPRLPAGGALHARQRPRHPRLRARHDGQVGAVRGRVCGPHARAALAADALRARGAPAARRAALHAGIA